MEEVGVSDDPRHIRAIARALAARGEGLLHGLTSAAAFPAAGLAGLHELVGAGLNRLKPLSDGYQPDVLKRMQDVNQAMTYEPRTEEGKRYLEEAANAPAVRGMDWLTHGLPQRAGEKMQEHGVPPWLAATAVTGMEMLPNLVGGKKGKVGKIPWDEMGLQEARAAAQRGEHLVPGSSGRYVGGPKIVDSPQALAAMRGGLDKAVEKGAFGADWYERARKAISEVSGKGENAPTKADQLSNMLALYSPQATPDVNMGHALKQINDVALRGSASKAKPFYERQAKKGRAIMAGVRPLLGPKVDVYEEHINPLKADQAKVRGVNDVWMGRAFGYPGDVGFNEAQHSFMTGENLRAAERAKVKGLLPEGTDPNVGNVQAAAWVGKRYDELLNQVGNKRKVKALHDAGDLEGALAFDKKLKDQAAQSYDTVLPKYTAAETYEQVPGRKTGHLEGAADLTYEEKQKLTREAGWAQEGEHDPLYNALGMYDRPGKEGEGFFSETVQKPRLQPALRDPKTDKVYTGGPDHGTVFFRLPKDAQERMPDFEPVSSGGDQRLRAGRWAGFVKNPEQEFISRRDAAKVAKEWTPGWEPGASTSGHLTSEEMGDVPLVDTKVSDKNPNFTARPMVSYGKGNTGLDPASESLLNQTNAFRSAMDAQAAGAWHAPEDAPWLGDRYKIGNYQELPWGKEGSGQVTDWLLGKVGSRVGGKLHTPEIGAALERKNVAETDFAHAMWPAIGGPRVDLQKLRGMVAEHGLEGVRAQVKAAGGGIAGAAKLGLPAWLLGTLWDGNGEEQSQ